MQMSNLPDLSPVDQNMDLKKENEGLKREIIKLKVINIFRVLQFSVELRYMADETLFCKELAY